MSTTSVFASTHSALNEITRTQDMVWAIDAGLSNLRQDIQEYYSSNPSANDTQAKNSVLHGNTNHRVSLKTVGINFSWEEEQQYVAELLLVNGFAIFDTWVDNIVDAAFVSVSKKQRDKIKKDLKTGDPTSLNNYYASEPKATLANCFHITFPLQTLYIDKLWLVYKYFKSLRNCHAHGSKTFTSIAETNYNAISSFVNTDIGVKEFPKIEPTVCGEKIVIYLRGVVGFYDVLLRIIRHYDTFLGDTDGLDSELINRWKTIPNYSKIELKPNKNAKYRTIRNYLRTTVCMYVPAANKDEFVYNHLVNNKVLKR